METYSAEKVAFWRFLRHIGYKPLTAKAENTPVRDSTPELLMDQIKITTKGARRNCSSLFLYGLVSGHALRYNQNQERLLRMVSMNRTTDDLLDALLSKQDLPEYFEENDAELQRQPVAYPDRHFGLRRVRHLCAGGGTGFLQLLLQLCGGGHSPSGAGGVLSFCL